MNKVAQGLLLVILLTIAGCSGGTPTPDATSTSDNTTTPLGPPNEGEQQAAAADINMTEAHTQHIEALEREEVTVNYTTSYTVRDTDEVISGETRAYLNGPSNITYKNTTISSIAANGTTVSIIREQDWANDTGFYRQTQRSYPLSDAPIETSYYTDDSDSREYQQGPGTYEYSSFVQALVNTNVSEAGSVQTPAGPATRYDVINASLDPLLLEVPEEQASGTLVITESGLIWSLDITYSDDQYFRYSLSEANDTTVEKPDWLSEN